MSTRTNLVAGSFTTTDTRTATPTVTAGRLLVWGQSFNTNTISNFGIRDSQGNTWQRVVAKAGSNPPNRKVELFWTIASATGTNNITASWTEAASGNVFIDSYDIPGTDPITVLASASFEEISNTSNNPPHYSAPEPGLSAVADNVMVQLGCTESSTGGIGAGAGWTLGAGMGTTAINQFQLPIGPVTDDRGPWTTTNARTAVSVMAVFGRGSPPPPEPEVVFQYPAVNVDGLNTGIN
jgi:hypothetical protein